MHSRTHGWTILKRQATTVACLLFLVGGLSMLHAQPKRFRPSPRYLTFGAPDQTDGRRILEDFRLRGLEGDYYFEFQLRYLPKRGVEHVVPGHLWGSRNERGPITKIALWPGEADKERRLLVQDGEQSAAWSWTPKGGDAVTPVGPATMFEPLGETAITTFDLQRPYIYWNEFVFEGVTNLKGRPAHVFLFYPPAEIVAARPALTGVRVYIDTAYHAMIQSEQIGPSGLPIRTFTLIDLKKVDEQWIPKAIDLRDDETRNKTRFSVTGAAVGLRLGEKLFEPANLAVAIPPPPAGKITPVGP